MAGAGYVLTGEGDPADYSGLRPPPLPGVAPAFLAEKVEGCADDD